MWPLKMPANKTPSEWFACLPQREQEDSDMDSGMFESEMDCNIQLTTYYLDLDLYSDSDLVLFHDILTITILLS